MPISIGKADKRKCCFWVIYKNKRGKKSLKTFHLFLISVRLIGLEPTRRGTLDPKSSASTNSATGADFLCFAAA